MRMVLSSEFVVLISALGDFEEAKHADLKTLIPFLNQDLASQIDELGQEEIKKEVLSEVTWISAQFLELGGGMVNGPGAYYRAEFSLPVNLVAAMAGFKMEELQNTEDPDVKRGNWMIQIPVEGPIRFLPDKMEFTDIQRYVNGYVQVVGVTYQGRRGRMVMNEDGHVLGLKINPRATDLVPELGVIVGNVVVVLGHKL